MMPEPIIDISMPLSTATPTWEDRFTPEVTWHSHTARGDRTSHSSWQLNAHTGTHLDAPLHHLASGDTTESTCLNDLIGPCRVLDLSQAAGHIDARDLIPMGITAGERILFRTQNSVRRLARKPHFVRDYTALMPEAAAFLAERDVGLIGIDYLAIEPFGGSGVVHRELLTTGVPILEGLDLTDVLPGHYNLAFLPLHLKGSEAAPGRAVLFTRDGQIGVPD